MLTRIQPKPGFDRNLPPRETRATDSDRLAYVEAATALMGSIGITLRTGTDFEEFGAVCSQCPERSAVNPSFDPREPEGTGLCGFWLAGFDRRGDLLHTQAMRSIDLAGQSLKEHLVGNGDRYRIRGFDLDMSRASISLTPEAAAIRGRTAYHGELWSRSGTEGVRGDGTLPILSRLMLMETTLRQAPEHVFGFISPTNACRGLAARLGYVHLEQRSVVYPQRDQPDAPPLEGWMVWMSAMEMDFNLRIEPEFFARTMGLAGSERRNAA